MKNRLSQIGLCLLILLGLSNCKEKAKEEKPADLVIKNASIYTVDATRSWAQALAVLDGSLVYVGTDIGADAFVGSRTRMIDLGGRFLLPGFHDSHMHPVEAGIQQLQCDLNNAKNVNEILDRIESYVKANPDRPWVLGRGWDQTFFPEANPQKSMLDSIVNNRPALFSDRGGHDIWINSRALEIAKITSQTLDPKGGKIERDTETGEPTGTLREKAASNFIEQIIPKPTNQENRDALVAAIKEANSYGIISFQDAKAKQEYIQAYLDVERQGDLTVRVRLAQEFVADKDEEEQIRKFLEIRRTCNSKHLDVGSVKLFIDGVFFNRTAALIEPYVGISPSDQNAYGMLHFDAEHLNLLVKKLDSEGFQVHMHAIGGRAIRMGLDAVEYAHHTIGVHDSRHHIAHLHMIHPTDVPRFRQLGVVAIFQPFWADTDDYNIKMIKSFVGPERFKRLHSFRSLMDSGAIVAAGSDWPVTSVKPLDAIEVAVTRRILGKKNGPALNFEQSVDLARIIAAYTIAGAYVNFEEKDSGSIEVGKWADFIVLDKNIFDIPSYEIHTTKVLWTVLEGREVFRAENWN
ncbi:amidohydrolase [Bacteroidota bacterium]